MPSGCSFVQCFCLENTSFGRCFKKKAAAFKKHSCSKWSRIASLKRNQQTCCKWRWCHSWLIGSQMDWHGLHGLWASNCNLSHHSTVMRTSTYTIQNDQKLGYGWKRFCIGKKRSCLGKNKRLCIGWKRRHQNCYATKEEGWASLIDVLHLSTLTYGNTVSSRQLFWRSGTFPKKMSYKKNERRAELHWRMYCMFPHIIAFLQGHCFLFRHILSSRQIVTCKQHVPLTTTFLF